jgi:GGDEF domain-containing protein
MSAFPGPTKGTASLLRELRDRDGETGLLTATRLYQALLAEIARSSRYGNPLSCVLVRIRGLDQDQDTARFELANRVAVVMRNTDYAGLWHEDEFLLVLPETNEAGARGFAAKLQDELVDVTARFTEGKGPAPTVAASITGWRTGDDAEAMLARLEATARV